MPKQYTSVFKEEVASTSGEEPVYLAEITHPQLSVPIRIVRDNQDLVSNGNTYIALPFDVQLPDDVSGQLPEAAIRFDNVGRELTQWIDQSQGGKGAQIRLMQVLRSDPDVIQYDANLDLLAVQQNGAYITGKLGYEDTLNLPLLAMSFRIDNTPGLF